MKPKYFSSIFSVIYNKFFSNRKKKFYSLVAFIGQLDVKGIPYTEETLKKIAKRDKDQFKYENGKLYSTL